MVVLHRSRSDPGHIRGDTCRTSRGGECLGAAIAQVSGETDRVFHGISRDAAILEATTQAKQRAVEAGAAQDTLKVVDLEALPISYLPGDARRLRIRVVGDVRG